MARLQDLADGNCCIKVREYFRSSAGTEWKAQWLKFWEFLKFFVRDLYANLAIVEFGKFQAFSVSVT